MPEPAIAPRAFASKMPMPGTLCALAAAYPLLVLTGMILFDYAIPGLDNRSALVGYAAIVLTFMSALHWGTAVCDPTPGQGGYWGTIREWRIFMTPFGPGLTAWIATLLPLKAGALVLLAAYGVALLYDARCVQWGESPPWDMRLRIVMSAIAAVALLFGVLLAKV